MKETPKEKNNTQIDLLTPKSKSALTETTCKRTIDELEKIACEQIKELHENKLLENELRVSYTDIELKQKQNEEELFKNGMQDIKFLEKMLNTYSNECTTELGFLKKQVSVLGNDKIKLQQNMIALASRVNSAYIDIFDTPPSTNSPL